MCLPYRKLGTLSHLKKKLPDVYLPQSKGKRETAMSKRELFFFVKEEGKESADANSVGALRGRKGRTNRWGGISKGGGGLLEMEGGPSMGLKSSLLDFQKGSLKKEKGLTSHGTYPKKVIFS